jgi:hypothetical protein
MNDKKDKSTTETPPAQPLHLGLRLQSVNQSDQPVFSNFTTVQGAPGMVFLDFGFLEPAMMPSLARLAKSGGKMPEAVSGRLACRVALGVDAAMQLTRQLEAHLQGLATQAAAAKGKPN